MMLSKTELKEIAKREKRRVAFHEAAHAAVCACFGGCGRAEMWQNTAENVKNGEKAWLGRYCMFAEPGTVTVSAEMLAIGCMPAPLNWTVLLGLAGLVAEHIAAGTIDPEEIGVEIDCTISMEEASQTDMDLMGATWGISDVAEVTQLLRERWCEVELLATSLMAYPYDYRK